MMEFQLFLAALVFFHLSEFALTATYNRRDLGWRSFLVSTPYCAAMGAACLEYAAEQRYAPGFKPRLKAVSWLGLAVVVLGEAIRKAAMITARHNFTHLIQYRRRQEHHLVTHGIYRWVRHGGYLGWLLWAVGTQLLLVNPVCTVGFAVAAWVFFSQRVPVEDRLLQQFFGPEFEEYRATVPSGLPWIT